MARMPLFKRLALVSALIWPMTSWSAADTIASSATSATSLLKLGLMLGVVILMFVAFAWMMKRMTGIRPRGGEDMKVTGGMSLGQRERLVVVEIDNQRLLLGVTSQNIQLIKELPSVTTFNETYQQAMPEKQL